MATGKRPRYDDEFRASAVLMLQAAGWPDKLGALERVAGHLGLQPRTLDRWAKGEQNPPPDQVVSEKRVEIVALIEAEVRAALGSLPGKREDANYKDTGTVIGILLDKLANLNGEPSQIIQQTIDFKRQGVSSVPQHLSPGANADSGGAPPV